MHCKQYKVRYNLDTTDSNKEADKLSEEIDYDDWYITLELVNICSMKNGVKFLQIDFHCVHKNIELDTSSRNSTLFYILLKCQFSYISIL